MRLIENSLLSDIIIEKLDMEKSYRCNIISTIWKFIGPQMHINIRIKQILGSQQQRRHRD
jgi:hypothetical protein